MATAFKIHLDDDSVTQFNEIKQKEIKGPGKRCVLGQIQNKHAIESYKNTNYATSKREIMSKEPAISATGFTNNIKALAIKDKDRRNVKKTSSARSPLKDLKNNRAIENANAGKVLSPMSIDASPHVKYEAKENILNQQRTETTDVQSPNKIVDDTKIKSNLDLASPMSVDVSPPHSSRNDFVKSALEDLYGCEVYKDSIYKYLKKIEEEYRPKAYYMRRQPDVSYSMRTILVDWLVEVGEEYKLKNETLFMAVSFIDRFLSTMAVAKPKLQLLGTSAMFIAAKFEEIYPPEVGEFTYITDDSYTVKQLLRMERLILKVLSFDLSCPTSYTFIMHISSCAKFPSKIVYLAMYICELTLLEADPYLDFYPSLIACGAIALARHCLHYADVWPSILTRITGYTYLQLGSVINNLNETHHKSFTLPHAAIRQKYSVAEYECVSKIPFRRLLARGSSVN